MNYMEGRKKDWYKRPLIIIPVAVFVLILVFVLLSDNPISNKISPISIITLEDENSSIIITKNNIDKTAKINMETYLDASDLGENEMFGDMTAFAVELGTPMMCGLLSMAFFNETALDEFNSMLDEWGEMDGTIEEDSSEEIIELEDNPLEGYEVVQVKFYMKEKATKDILSECLINDYGDIVMKIDGEEVTFEE